MKLFNYIDTDKLLKLWIIDYGPWSILLICILITLSSCKPQPPIVSDGLIKLSNQELIQRAKDYNFPVYNNLIFRDETGKELTQEYVSSLDQQAYYGDQFVDDSGQVKEIVIRLATEEDKAFRKKLVAAGKEAASITVQDVDCTQIKAGLAEAYKKDQDNRSSGSQIDPKIDRDNLTYVVSVLERCGMPSSTQVGKDGTQAVWLVLQHSKLEYMEQYLPLLKQSAEIGDLSKTSIAMMEDRVLMFKGEPQIYGTQISGDGQGNFIVYDLMDPETVDSRRAAIGFTQNLSDYANQLGANFSVPQIR